MSICYSQLGKCGRFANQIMQAAGLISIGLKYGHEFYFPEKWINHDAAERFGTTEDIEVYKYFVNPLPVMPEGIAWTPVNYFWGHREIMLPPYGNYDFSGIHFQSDKYWKGYEATIRHYMTMKDEPEYIDACAVHVRHGDYSGFNEGYHPRCGIDYYRKAMEFVSTHILLFSDDIKGASEMFDEIGVKYTAITDDYLKSFRIMKRCKEFVIANSSYSLAAAMLADQPGKIIVCPKDWFGPAFGGGYKEMSNDIYPEGSVIL